MERFAVTLFTCLALVLAGLVSFAEETETEVSLNDLPEKAKTTIGAFGAAGEIEEIVMEEEDGEVVYEAEIEIGEMEFEIEVSPEGVLLEVETEQEDDAHGDMEEDDEEDDD